MSRNVAVPLDAVGALHADAKRYPRGMEALAKVIGRSPGVLYNKFSEADDRYAVTDREADALALEVASETGLQGYIEAKCATHGGLFLPVPEGVAGDDDLLQGQLQMMRRFGELAAEFTEARADGLITPDEFAAVRVAGLRAVREVFRFLADLETRVEEAAPAASVPLRAVGRGR